MRVKRAQNPLHFLNDAPGLRDVRVELLGFHRFAFHFVATDGRCLTDVLDNAALMVRFASIIICFEAPVHGFEV